MSSTSIVFIIFMLIGIPKGILGARFTLVNKCEYTVWPGTLANAGGPKLDSTGFELGPGDLRAFQAPAKWSGRIWGRTGCRFDSSTGQGNCTTGDCGPTIECNGAGAIPPTTLAEFTIGDSGTQDFYDVSLVDGYNLPMKLEAIGGSGTCGSTGCTADLNKICPIELRARDGQACNSACGALGKAEYCCNGAYSSPSICKSSVYSRMFKMACPTAYTYAYDDATSTFTCTRANYLLTFCPSITRHIPILPPPLGGGTSNGHPVATGALNGPPVSTTTLNGPPVDPGTSNGAPETDGTTRDPDWIPRENQYDGSWLPSYLTADSPTLSYFAIHSKSPLISALIAFLVLSFLH